jgi:hypothetical protein
MRPRPFLPLLLVVPVLAALSAGADAFRVKLDDLWRAPDSGGLEFKKVLVIAITDDSDVRRTFENRFVSHLRGQEIEGVTSYSMVPDLTRVEDEDDIVERIHAERIDGAISVRAVPLGKDDPSFADWVAAWRAANDEPGDLRRLIDDSLPVLDGKAKQYGIEVALWETGEWRRIWGGRSSSYTRKQLRKGAADLVQYVMHVLQTENLL